MNDADIISLFWARSETAITELGNKYDRLARSVAMNILHDRLDTEECMNDSYLGMWNSLPPEKPQILPAFFRLKSYDAAIIDAAAQKVVEVAKRNGSKVSGPIPLPTDREIVTILRAVHKYKDSREQFEMRTHKRLIDILDPQAKTVEALMSIELPAGVEIEIKA